MVQLLLFEEQYSEGLQSQELAALLDPWWTLGQSKLEGICKITAEYQQTSGREGIMILVD